MSKGQELLLGANDPQESPLGSNAAEQSRSVIGAIDRTTLANIAELCDRYDRMLGRKAHHYLIQIGVAAREALSTDEPEGGD